MISQEKHRVKRDWHEIFKVMKSKDLHPRLLYPARLSFTMEDKINNFPGKNRLKDFITTKTVLQEVLKSLL